MDERPFEGHDTKSFFWCLCYTDGNVDEDAAANLCVLLHGSIKVENMAAICLIGPCWYGALFHLADSKRSNLTLNCFHVGADAVPWLGRLDRLTVRRYGDDVDKNPFPVGGGGGGGGSKRPSYVVAPTWWAETYGLQNDIQKVVRYLKKLPDRKTIFYQELNRVLQHSLALGFDQLPPNLADLLSKESTLNCTPDIRRHCDYVLDKLRGSPLRYGDLIEPL